MNSEKFRLLRVDQMKRDNKSETPRSVGKKNLRLQDVKSLENKTSRPIKNISEISRLGQNFCRLTFFELPFFTPLFPPKPLEKFTDKHTTHISAQRICSTNKYRIQGHNNFKVLNRSGLEAC